MDSYLLLVVAVILVLTVIIMKRKTLKSLCIRLPFLTFDVSAYDNKSSLGQGGKGGDSKAIGKNSAAIGGVGGDGGRYGKGGDGGNAEAIGDNSFAMGGEGGEAGQSDRGGRGGRSPFEILGRGDEQLPYGTFLRNYGRGGDGANPVHDDKPKNDY